MFHIFFIKEYVYFLNISFDGFKSLNTLYLKHFFFVFNVGCIPINPYFFILGCFYEFKEFCFLSLNLLNLFGKNFLSPLNLNLGLSLENPINLQLSNSLINRF